MNTTVYTGRATNWSSVILSGLLLIPLIGMGLSSGSSPSTGAVILVVARASEGEGMAIAEMDVALLTRIRASLPALQHRRL